MKNVPTGCPWQKLHHIVGGGPQGLHGICAGGSFITLPAQVTYDLQSYIAQWNCAQHSLFGTLDVSSCLSCRAYALRDYYPFWKSHQERSTAGKALSAEVHAAAQAAAAGL